MVEKIIKRFDVISVGKIYGMLGVIMGAIVGIIFLLLAFIGFPLGGASSSILLGLFSLILYPIFLGIGGFINGVIIAFLYNVAANWIGGVKVDLE